MLTAEEIAKMRATTALAHKLVKFMLDNGGPSAGETYFVDRMAKDMDAALTDIERAREILERIGAGAFVLTETNHAAQLERQRAALATRRSAILGPDLVSMLYAYLAPPRPDAQKEKP